MHHFSRTFKKHLFEFFLRDRSLFPQGQEYKYAANLKTKLLYTSQIGYQLSLSCEENKVPEKIYLQARKIKYLKNIFVRSATIAPQPETNKKGQKRNVTNKCKHCQTRVDVIEKTFIFRDVNSIQLHNGGVQLKNMIEKNVLFPTKSFFLLDYSYGAIFSLFPRIKKVSRVSELVENQKRAFSCVSLFLVACKSNKNSSC